MNTHIFVFGSNLAGRHGKGAALCAKLNYGAKQGVSNGLTGRAYAIPTKDEYLNTLPLLEIAKYVGEFLNFAHMNPDLEFHMTRIGCGLAGYKDPEIKPMFFDVPENVILPKEWL